MTKIKKAPATPLPWETSKGEYAALLSGPKYSPAWQDSAWDRDKDAIQDVAYIIHAANAYPRLVDALKKAIASADGWSDDDRGVPADDLDNERALLVELGEE